MARRALIVGDNYPGTSSQLSGCVNDATQMRDYFTAQGFDDLTVLLNRDATKDRIERELDRLVGGLTGKDLGVFYDSGHGTQGSMSLAPGQPATKHEGIVPYDFRTAGIIWDAHLRELLTPVDPDARLVVIFDTCFSGGMYRLAPPISDHYRRARYLPPAEWLRDEDLLTEARKILPEGIRDIGLDRDDQLELVLSQIRGVADQRAVKAYPVLLLSASQPNQVSWCAEVNGRPCGAFTYALGEVLEGRGPGGNDQPVPGNYRQVMFGGRDLAGVATLRASRPGWLPSVDLADQQPDLYGTDWRTRWNLFQA